MIESMLEIGTLLNRQTVSLQAREIAQLKKLLNRINEI